MESSLGTLRKAASRRWFGQNPEQRTGWNVERPGGLRRRELCSRTHLLEEEGMERPLRGDRGHRGVVLVSFVFPHVGDWGHTYAPMSRARWRAPGPSTDRVHPRSIKLRGCPPESLVPLPLDFRVVCAAQRADGTGLWAEEVRVCASAWPPPHDIRCSCWPESTVLGPRHQDRPKFHPPPFLAVTFLSDPYFDWLSLVGKLQNSCLNSEPKMTWKYLKAQCELLW